MGKRRRPNVLVDVQRKLDVDDGHGGTTRDWVTVGDLWVTASPIGGTEALKSGTLTAEEKWRLESSYADIRTEDRLIMDGKPLNVRSAVDPDHRQRRLVILTDTLATG